MRYAEIAPIDSETSAFRGLSRRWYRIAAPFAIVEYIVRTLDSDGWIPTAEGAEGVMLAEATAAIKSLLVQDGNLIPSANRACLPRVLLAGTGSMSRRLHEVGGGIFANAIIASPDDVLGYLPGQDVVLIDRDGLDDRYLRAVGQRCADKAVAWAPIGVEAAAGWFGPLFRPGGELVIDDLLGRWATTSRPMPWQRETEILRLGSWLEFSDTELAWMGAVIGAELSRFTTGEPYLSQRSELELSPGSLGVVEHVVLPLPFGERGPVTPAPPIGSPEDLVDARTGVITRISRMSHHPSIPRELINMRSRVAALRRISPWQPDPIAAGTSYESEELARQAAIGEAAERYSGEIVRPELLTEASWDELRRRQEHAADPDTLVMFSQAQYTAPGFPFVPMTRDRRFHWVRGRSLTKDCPAWLPANLVYGNWYVGPYRNTTPFNNIFHPGLAAGPDLDFAVAAGIQEVVERHATMAWWANTPSLPKVRLSARLAALWEGAPTRLGQRASLIFLDNEFAVPVMAGVVENDADQLLTIGFAARPDPEAAALKAWAEALTLQDGARDLQRQTGGYRQAAARGDVNEAFVKPWRADRRYLDDYRDDFHDVVDLMSQLQMYLDPRAIERVRHIIGTPATLDLAELPRLADYSMGTYQRVVEARGYEIFYADITTRDVARAGLTVVRVLIPGLIPNSAAAFPYLGRRRVQDVAVELGWRDTPLAEDDLNRLPLPHA